MKCILNTCKNIQNLTATTLLKQKPTFLGWLPNTLKPVFPFTTHFAKTMNAMVKDNCCRESMTKIQATMFIAIIEKYIIVLLFKLSFY